MLYHLTPSYFIKQRAANTDSDRVDTTKHDDKVTHNSQDDAVSSEVTEECPPQNISITSGRRSTQQSLNQQLQNISSQIQESSPPPCSSTGRTSPPCPTSPPSWRSISVSTRWRWDDIWHTENDVQIEGNGRMCLMLLLNIDTAQLA
jgi:hypothetical protein